VVIGQYLGVLALTAILATTAHCTLRY